MGAALRCGTHFFEKKLNYSVFLLLCCRNVVLLQPNNIYMKKNILTFLLLFVSIALLAAPAKRGQWRTITLEDGTSVRAELCGDEHVSFYQSKDGRVFQPVFGQKYCRQVERAVLAEKAMASREAAVAMQETATTQNRAGVKKIALGGNHIPYIGTKKCLCILVEFKDVPFSMSDEQTKEHFSNIVNKVGYKDDALGYVGSVRDYFRAQSDGQFDIEFDVVGPFQLNYNQSYYGAHGMDGSNDVRAGKMIQEAVAQADGYVNFADYDWDGDGNVEPIYVVYSGMGEADGGGENTIWPHKSSISRERHDGVYVRDYACGSELNGAGKLGGVGTMCHEYSHCLGLPDMYDTSYSGVYGTASWDLMNDGCYNGDGYIPASYNAYERWYAGWITPEELTEDSEIIDMKPITSGGQTYIIRNDNRNYKDEYYLLENRAKEGWDSALPGAGLLVYHVDFNSTAWAYNMVNTIYPGVTQNPRFQVVPADGSFNHSDVATDVFPSGGNNSLMDNTEPSTELFNPNARGEFYLSKPIRNIKLNEDGTIEFMFYGQNFEPEGKPEGAFFYESFSFCENVGGNDGNYSPTGKIKYIADNPGWQADNAYGGSSCAYFGTNVKKGSATTPEFYVPVGNGAVLTFRAVPFGSEAKSINLSVASGTAELETTSVALTSKTWQEYSVRIIGSGKMSLNFTSNSRRFFLDEICVMPYEEADAIENVSASQRQNNSASQYFNLAGQRVGEAYKGVVVKDGKKVMK